MYIITILSQSVFFKLSFMMCLFYRSVLICGTQEDLIINVLFEPFGCPQVAVRMPEQQSLCEGVVPLL